MPYKDKELRLRMARNSHRKERHGKDWRGYVDFYDGICAECGSIESLELHNPMGTDDSEHIFQTRILICFDCHSKQHTTYNFHPYHRLSLMLEDISAETRECGSYSEWVEKYKVGKV